MFEDKIKRLELTIEGYAETYEQAPDGYICNTMYLDLKIPVGEGAYTEAYWVTAAHNRYVQCYGLPFRDWYHCLSYVNPYVSQRIEAVW